MRIGAPMYFERRPNGSIVMVGEPDRTDRLERGLLDTEPFTLDTGTHMLTITVGNARLEYRVTGWDAQCLDVELVRWTDRIETTAHPGGKPEFVDGQVRFSRE